MSEIKIDENYEINIVKLTQIFLKNKILIISSIIVFTVAAHLYTLTLDKTREYESFISIKFPNQALFIGYEKYVSDSELQSEFNKNLNSNKTLKEFIEQNNNIQKFKDYLKSNNMQVHEYFKKKKFRKSNLIDAGNDYFLIYHESLDGNKFLDDYVIFVKNKTLKEIKNRVQQRIEAEIASLELSLKIAKDINLEKSLVQKMMDKSVNTFLMTPPSEKFYKGSIILEYEVNNYQELLNKLVKKDFDYDPILNQSVVTNTFAENYKIFPYVGFAIGLLFSLFVVYIRYISSLR